MSGGVDSSVAAALMLQSGYECAGITIEMLCSEGRGGERSASGSEGAERSASGSKVVERSARGPKEVERSARGSEGAERSTSGTEVVERSASGSKGAELPSCVSRGAADAAIVCEQLGIPHYTLHAEEEFLAQVVEPFVAGYCAGWTPNPCIACNRHLKFSTLLSWAEAEGFDFVATGHYARIQDGRLIKAWDAHKDQSYVLYMLTSEQLERLYLPLGDYRKDEVRALAVGLGLATAEKEESQDICFVQDGDYAGFIERHLLAHNGEVPKAGKIRSLDGTPLGSHEGIHHYTIGQRRGLGIAGSKPLYVVDIDASEATVWVGTEEESGRYVATIEEVNLLCPESLVEGQVLHVKHRYRGREHAARVFLGSDNTGTIVFEEKQRDLTKGQALVIYEGECVLGGGTIVATA